MRDVALGGLMAMTYLLAPGPVILETLRRGWKGGFGVAWQVQLGALLGDLLYALLAWLGLTLALQQPQVMSGIGLTGTLLLVYLGCTTLYQAWRTPHQLLTPVQYPYQSGSTVRALREQHFWLGAALALTNPYGLLFWLAIDHTILGKQHPGMFLMSFFIIGLGTATVIALLAHRSARLMTPRVTRIAAGGFGVVLLGCAISLTHTLINGFSPR